MSKQPGVITQSRLGDTPLHTAIRLCDMWTDTHGSDTETKAFETSQMAFVMHLINAGADVSAKNSDGYTAEKIAKRGGHKRMEALLFVAAIVSRRY
jgi:hypothetical protein